MTGSDIWLGLRTPGPSSTNSVVWADVDKDEHTELTTDEYILLTDEMDLLDL